MKKEKIMLSVLLMMGVALLPISSKAVLQANPNTNGQKKDLGPNWINSVRNMETKNQAMGLEEKIDSTTLKAATESNGIDVHMIKTTEWGTLAILSASGYGNSKKMQDSTIKTTTGNKSGVYIPLDWEWTAGVGTSGTSIEGFPVTIDSKYYNTYRDYDSTYSSAKVGDALGNNTATNSRMCKMA